MNRIKKVLKGWNVWKRRLSAVLACIVVFVTVYAMVLPAITLDRDAADQEEGIVLETESAEQESDSAQTATASEEYDFSDLEASIPEAEELEDEEDTWAMTEGPVTLQWPAEPAEPEEEEAEEAVFYDESGEEINYFVEATFGEDSGLPADVTLQVAEIKAGTEEYEAYHKSALEAVRKEGGDETEISYARFFDITFFTADGEVIEPTGPVSIVIRYKDEKELKAETAEDLSVVHFAQEDQESQETQESPNELPQPEIMNIETEIKDDQVESITFGSESFSVYGVVGTFNVEVDAEEGEGGEHVSFSHSSSLKGGCSMLLSELLEEAWPDREDLRIGNVAEVTTGEMSSEDDSADEADEGNILKVSFDETEEDYEITADTEQGDDLSGQKGTLRVRFNDGNTAAFRITISGTPQVDAGDGLAVISSADGSYLPETAEGSAEELAAEAISDSAAETVDAGGSDTVSRVFDISLNLSQEELEAYNEGFLVNLTLPEEVTGRDFHLYHIHDGFTEELAIEKTGSEPDEAGLETVSGIQFVTESFSEFVLQYTVDFHYELNGKMFEFSIPGGGFVSLEHLVEVLGIASAGGNTENEEKNAENDSENGNDFAEEAPASEDAEKFIVDVESVEFSNPELVWVGKADRTDTVGELKKANGLIVEYSTDLTEEQIAEYNAQTVEAGDWALISVHPFTSEESLTVTMKDGEQFVVKVTDAQIKKTVIDARGDKWEITVTYGEDAQIPDGAELRVREILPEDKDYLNYYDQSLKTVGVPLPKGSKPAETENDSTADPERGSEIVSSAASATEAETESAFRSEQEYKIAEPAVDNYTRIFDIEIWADDKKVEPKSNVTVTVRLLDAPEKTELLPHVVHFAENGTELMKLAGKQENDENEIRFKTDAFSVYSVIYTADLHYDAETGTLSYEDNKIKVTVSAKDKAKAKDILPDEAILIVKEMLPEDSDAADMYAQALTALSDSLREQSCCFSAVKVYDFSILDKEGNEIEPDGDVDVKIEYKEKPELGGSDVCGADIQIAHLVEDPLEKEGLSVEIMEAAIDATDLGIVSGAEFTTDSFSAYIVFNKNGISQTEPTDLGNYGWIRFYTVGEQDTTQNQTSNPDSTTIQWGYYKNDGSNLPNLNTNWAYRRILKVRLWLPKSGQDSSVYDSDHYNEAATAQYFWVWQNEVNVEEFELPGYEVVHTRMHTAWDEENGRQPAESDSLVGSYAVRGYRRSTISNEPGAKNSDLNVLDIYAKRLPQTTGMNYIIRYVHADGSVTDGNVRSLSSGSVTYNASHYQRDGEVYAGTSIVTGSDAINANTAYGTGTITYKSDVPLAKVYVYYKINPEGNGNPTTRGRYDKDENGYYTGAKGLYTDKSAEAVAGKDRQFILNLESWYVDNAASVGMVLDSSGSMAWTSGVPEPIVLTDQQVAKVRIANGMWQDQWGRWQGNSDIFFNGGSNDSVGNPPHSGQYITNLNALSLILDNTKTDNSAMGYNGYHYYLKDMRSTVREYVALGYSDGNQSGSESLGGKTIYTTKIGNTSYTGTVLANRFIKNENNAYGPNEGWYYVNSSGNTKAYYKYTGKSYDGYSSKGNVTTLDGTQINLAGGPLRFYIKTGTNELWVSYYDGSNGDIRQSPVYEKRDKMFTKMETLQDAVSQFGAIVLGSSPDSQIGLTRFSQNIKTSNNTDNQLFDNSSYLPLLNWSSSTEELSAAMNLSKNAKGSTRRNDDGLTVYEYGLTGQTRTWTGVKAYSDYLKSNAAAPNHKYLIVFTDGKDTNGDADKSTGNPPWGETGKQIQALKNDGYTIITVMMRSQAMVGSEYTTAKAFLQGIASPGLDGNTSNTAADNKLYFEADSNSTKDVIDAFRQIANRIASGLNGYTVRDYIDPRFDVLNDAGDILTVLDSNGQFTHITNPDVDEATGLRGFTTPDNKHAYLGYDSAKKMFYVLWKDQEIPASTLDSESVNPWKSKIRIQAKEDFLGGNEILSNGNEPGMNQVYYPDSNGNPTISTNYPRKDFPRTTVNPATLDIRLSNYEDTIFLGENISPASLYANVQTKRDQETDSRELYFDYLVRAGKKLHNDPTFYLNILKYAAVPENYEAIRVKDRNGTPLESVEIDGSVKGITLTLPYYYLENPGDDSSYAGGTLHQGDKVGTITYKWTALTTGGHTLTDGNALKDYSSSVTDTVRYQLSVSYMPDSFVSNHLETNGRIAGDSIPDNGSARTQTLIGETGTGSLIRDPNGIGAWAAAKNTNEGSNADTQGLAAIHVVDGKIKVSKRIEISQSAWEKLVASAGASGLEFVFRIKKNGADYGSPITINSNTAAVTFPEGYVTLETDDWVTGLPQGDYTLVETAQPAGFTFKSVTAAAVTAEDGGTQYAAPTTGSITWKIGQYASGTPSACSYADTDFSAVKVKDNNKEVDPGKSAGSGKNYLNAQIGKGVVLNEPPKTIDVTLKKVDKADLANNSAALLRGATFTITRYTDNTFSVKDTSASAWTATLEDRKEGDSYTLNGNFEFKDLPVGYYKLDESVMPAGYITMTEAPVFEVRANSGTSELEVVLYKKNGSAYTEVASGSTDMARIDAVNTIYIANEPGAALPNTGGPGTTVLYILGIMLTAFAGTGLVMRKRRRDAA